MDGARTCEWLRTQADSDPSWRGRLVAAGPGRPDVSLILHIAERARWEGAGSSGVYRADSLDSEGFIHSSTPRQVIRVANGRFRGRRGMVLLCIDPDRVGPEVRYEAAEGGERFPHIYGPLNLDAVVNAVDFEPGADGTFQLPKEVVHVDQ